MPWGKQKDGWDWSGALCEITYVILGEVDGLFCYPWARDRFHEQTRAAEVELIVDGEAGFILREHHIVWTVNLDL
jgi:hypothetical protein